MDWYALICERLSLADLPLRQRQETIAELAAHLDDLYVEYCAQGLSESEAVTRAASEVKDWRGLAKTIQRSKLQGGKMNDRTRHIWLPGFVSLTGAVLIFAALVRFGVEPHLYYTRYAALVFYFPWLAGLPFCGAAGAYISRRAGGERIACMICGLFPAFALLISIASIIFFIPIFGRDGIITPQALAIVVGTWILVPGALLLLGTLPFLLRPSRGIRLAGVLY